MFSGLLGSVSFGTVSREMIKLVYNKQLTHLDEYFLENHMHELNKYEHISIIVVRKIPLDRNFGLTNQVKSIKN